MPPIRTALLAAVVSLASACDSLTPTLPDQGELSSSFHRAAASDPTPSSISLEKIGEFVGAGEGAAEITAYNEVSRRLFVVNGALGSVDVLDMSDPTTPRPIGVLSVAGFGRGATSVASNRNIVAVAIEAYSKTDPGTVAIYRSTTLDLISSVTVGSLPDMLTFTPSGKHILVANEGEPDGYLSGSTDPEGSVSVLNPAVFTPAACGGPCTDDSLLGRLTVTTTKGQNAQTGLYDVLFAFGGRSFSIWSTDGREVWDSADELEQRTRSLPMVNFNASNDNDDFDDRSDKKGPEPEGVVLGQLGSKTFAFVGLERVGGVMVYDVTRPSSPSFVTYVNTRNGSSGDLGPEGLVFVPAVHSSNKQPLLIVGNEVSGTTTIFEIRLR